MVRENWGMDKEWTSPMSEEERERQYQFCKKAVTRTFDWLE